MAFFKSLDVERSECVLLKTLIGELAEQEAVPVSEIAAILLREYEEVIPFNEQFYFYYYDIVKSFVKAHKWFGSSALSKVAQGGDINNTPFMIEVQISEHEFSSYDICV